MKKSIVRLSIVLFAALSAPTLLPAQGLGGLPADGGMDVMQPAHDGTSVPVDMGLGLAIAGGIGYAVKKRRDKRRLANQAK